MIQNISSEYLIYKDLQQKILVGQIKEGDRLVETTLAADYKTSRLHIKSALRLLEQEKLAQHIPQCGFIAKEVTEKAMNEIVELRIALEKVIFKQLIEIITAEDISHLRKTVQRVAVFIQNDMIEDAMEEVDHFYNFVYQLSHYERIISILTTYDNYLQIIRRKSALDMSRNLASLNLLLDMMHAIENRDTETLLKHIERRKINME